MTEAEKISMQKIVDRHKGGKTFGRKQAPLPPAPSAPRPEPVRFHTDQGFVSSSDIVLGLVMALVVAGVVVGAVIWRAL